MKSAQKLATRIFISASLLFGIDGIIIILSTPKTGSPPEWMAKLLGVLGFIILSSFGVSVGFKYLNGK